METDYHAQRIDIASESDARRAILAVDASEEAALIMAPKTQFFIIALKNVRNAVASILKQEMLAAGADAAVSKHAVDCSKPATDVLLFGTLAQYRRVLIKMRGQGLGIRRKPEYAEKFKEYYQLANEIETILKAGK